MRGFERCKALDILEFKGTDTFLWLRDQLRQRKADAFNQLLVYAAKSLDTDVAKAFTYYKASLDTLEAVDKLKAKDDSDS